MVGSRDEEENLGRVYDARLMRRLLAYVKPYRGRVVLAVLVLFTGAALALVGPWLTKIAIDRAIPQGDIRLLGILALAFIGTLLSAFVLEYAQAILTAWLGQRIMYDLRREIFAKLQRLSLPYYDRNPVGRMMTRVTSDVEVLNQLFSSGIVTVFGDVFTLVFIIAAMLALSWKLALVTFAVLPFVFLSAFFFRTRIRDAFREERKQLARLNSFLQERISGIAVVRLFGQESRSIDRFQKQDQEYLEPILRSVTYYALFFPTIEILTAVAFALIIWYGGASVLDGTLTIGIIAAFLQWARRFFQPIQDLSEKYNMLQGAMASAERIFGLLDAEGMEPKHLASGDGDEADATADATANTAVRLPTPGRGEIEFRDVWFAYVDEQWVLKSLSFRARPGEKVAVVGHTGAGKSTIISLLMRFYEPQRGEILFDGVPIARVPIDELRERIGLVLQDIFLFSRDVAYNIRLGRSDIDDRRLRNAAARVGAAPIVERLEKGYETPVGERGASLSVGERQLFSFARALAFDPLVLVLDEATSSVDSELEERIEHAVDTLMQGRTSIVIAHRLSTIQHSDRILVLHHGELREEGSHAELLRRGGLYSRLHELQFVRGSTDGEAPVAAAGD